MWQTETSLGMEKGQQLKNTPWEISPVWPAVIIWAVLMSGGLMSLMRLINVLSSLATYQESLDQRSPGH